MKTHTAATLRFAGAITLAALPFIFTGCTTDDDPPPYLTEEDIANAAASPTDKAAAKNAELDEQSAGIEVPAAAGIVRGDVKNVREYVDRVTESNKQNAERARSGDWNYSRSPVGPNNDWY